MKQFKKLAAPLLASRPSDGYRRLQDGGGATSSGRHIFA